MKTEAEVRLHYPHAVWMPWDAPPIGERVVTESGHLGTVTGASPVGMAKRPHACPTCTCPPPADRLRGWWTLALESPIPVDGGDDLTGAIVYPPSLRRAT